MNGPSFGPLPAFRDEHFVYANTEGQELCVELFRNGPDDIRRPILLWLPRLSLAEQAAGRVPQPGDTRIANPITSYMAYGFAVASIDYRTRASRQQDVADLIDYLSASADRLGLDASKIALVTATAGKYSVEVIRGQRQGPDNPPRRLELPAAPGAGANAIAGAVIAPKVTEFLSASFGTTLVQPRGEVIGTHDPDLAWIDPITLTPEGTTYHLYPSTVRGKATFASCLVYLPEGYAQSARRYPAIYYLHGGNGNQREVRLVLSGMIKAMREGQMPPTIIVGAQALPIGWYVNANATAPGVISGPVEDLIIKDLVPFIDNSFRTIDDTRARGLEGWSMGGFGALRLAFKYPDLFGSASSLAGAVIDFDDEPIKDYVTNTFGPVDALHHDASMAHFDATRPSTWARINAARIIGRTNVRLVVGDKDWLYSKEGKPITENFSKTLDALGIAHSYTVLPGIDHMLPAAIAAGSTPYPAQFWADAFAIYK